jgi:hypothetical protein
VVSGLRARCPSRCQQESCYECNPVRLWAESVAKLRLKFVTTWKWKWYTPLKSAWEILGLPTQPTGSSVWADDHEDLVLSTTYEICPTEFPPPLSLLQGVDCSGHLFSRAF